MKELLKYINLAKEAGCSIEFVYSNRPTEAEYFTIKIENKSFARGTTLKICFKDLEKADYKTQFKPIITNMIKQVSTW